MKFGEVPGEIIDIEADEKLFAATAVFDTDGGGSVSASCSGGNAAEDAAEDASEDAAEQAAQPLHASVGATSNENMLIWLGLPYIAVMERGDVPGPHGRIKLWIECMGHSMSRCRKRLPRLPPDHWRRVLASIHLSEKANVALHSDGGDCVNNAYALIDHPGIVAKTHVNHSEKEWTRQVRLPRRRQGIAGDQLVEAAWKLIRPYTKHIGCLNDVELELAVREGQWHVVIGSGADAYRLWCSATRSLRAWLEAEQEGGLQEQVFAFPQAEETAVRLLRNGDRTPLRQRVRNALKKAGGLVAHKEKNDRRRARSPEVNESSTCDEACEEELRCGATFGD